MVSELKAKVYACRYGEEGPSESEMSKKMGLLGKAKGGNFSQKNP